jgi:hypothetical protein
MTHNQVSRGVKRKMKKLKSKNIYKASNVTFDADKVSAHSYVWWEFVKVIQGQVVFNCYKYSPTTQRHQRKVEGLMNDLGINIDLVVNVKQSLSDFETLKSVIKRSLETYQKQADDLAKKKKENSIKNSVKRLNKLGLYSEQQWQLIKDGMHPDSTVYHQTQIHIGGVK